MTASIVSDKINLESVIEAAQGKDMKSVILAVGKSSAFSGRDDVDSIFYETYSDLAPGVLENIEKDARDRFRITGVSIIHRFGKIAIGEITYAIAVSALRHEDAFQACRFMVDGLNSDLPVWKYEMPVRRTARS